MKERESNMNNKENSTVPSVTFRTRENGAWKDVTTDQIFKGKKIVVFSLPGAFTPTCSSSHVPRYNELVKEFAAAGIDSVVCISVNDGFVMDEWAKAQAAENIVFLPDGNAEFTQGMGMLVDKRNLGFGQRSWRYSMLVDDGTVKKMFIEPEKDGDPFEVSDADTMLRFVSPGAKLPHDVLMFTKPNCSHCARAKALLAEKGIPYEDVAATPRRLRAVSERGTTPQVFIDGKYIGGADELATFFQNEAKPV